MLHFADDLRVEAPDDIGACISDPIAKLTPIACYAVGGSSFMQFIISSDNLFCGVKVCASANKTK